MNDTRLQTALQFTADDLQANRRGELSPRQRALLGVVNRFASGCLLSAGAFGVIATTSVAASAGWEAALVILAVEIVLFGAGFIAFRRARRLMASLTVVPLTGDLRKLAGNTIDIGGKRLRIRPDAYAVFEDGAAYTVYHIPQTGAVLSAEPHA